MTLDSLLSVSSSILRTLNLLIISSFTPHNLIHSGHRFNISSHSPHICHRLLLPLSQPWNLPFLSPVDLILLNPKFLYFPRYHILSHLWRLVSHILQFITIWLLTYTAVSYLFWSLPSVFTLLNSKFFSFPWYSLPFKWSIFHPRVFPVIVQLLFSYKVTKEKKTNILGKVNICSNLTNTPRHS